MPHTVPICLKFLLTYQYASLICPRLLLKEQVQNRDKNLYYLADRSKTLSVLCKYSHIQYKGDKNALDFEKKIEMK